MAITLIKHAIGHFIILTYLSRMYPFFSLIIAGKKDLNLSLLSRKITKILLSYKAIGKNVAFASMFLDDTKTLHFSLIYILAW